MKPKERLEVRLSLAEERRLSENAKACGLSKSAYVRQLISGYEPKEQPYLNYHLLIRELKRIGNNLNQIAYIANSTGTIDGQEYHAMALLVRQKIREMEKGVLEPEDGNDEDLADEPFG